MCLVFVSKDVWIRLAQLGLLLLNRIQVDGLALHGAVAAVVVVRMDDHALGVLVIEYPDLRQALLERLFAQIVDVNCVDDFSLDH